MTTLADLRKNPATHRLRAVRGGRFVVLDENLLVPGPRIGDGLDQVARLLHPDAFAELDAVTVDGYGTLVRLLDPVSEPRPLAGEARSGPQPGARPLIVRSRGCLLPAGGGRGRDPDSLARLRCDCTRVFLDAAGVGLEAESLVDDFMASIRFEAIPGATRRGDSVAVGSTWRSFPTGMSGSQSTWSDSASATCSPRS